MPDEMKPIPGFPHYFVTRDGRVWSAPRVDGLGRAIGGLWLKPGRQNTGHLKVILRRDGKSFNRLIHQLVLGAFLGPCPEGMECCHYDGDPTNNHIDNLRWDTHSNNALDSVKHEVFSDYRGERHPQARLTELDVLWIRILSKCGVRQVDLARLHEVTPQHIANIVDRKTWRHVA